VLGGGGGGGGGAKGWGSIHLTFDVVNTAGLLLHYSAIERGVFLERGIFFWGKVRNEFRSVITRIAASHSVEVDLTSWSNMKS
jgi:hypothetical protein